MKRAALYLRVSTFDQHLETQLYDLRQLETALPLTRRLLWSSSGEDLAARIRSAWG